MPAFGVLAVILTLFFPGLGQGFAGQRRRMIVWAVGTAATALLILVTVWFTPVMLVARIASAVDAYRSLTRSKAASSFINAAMALFIGLLAFGGVRVFAIEGFKIPSSSMYPTLIIGDHIFTDKVSVRWHAPERGEVIVFTHPCSQQTMVKRVVARGGDTVEVRCSIVYVNGKALPQQRLGTSTYKDADSRGSYQTRTSSRYRETQGDRAYDTFHATERPSTPAPDIHDFPRVDAAFTPSCTQGDYFEPTGRAPAPQPQGRIVQAGQPSDPCAPFMHFEVPAGALFMMGDNRNNANDSRYWGLIDESAVIGRVIGIWMSDGPDGSWGRFGALD